MSTPFLALDRDAFDAARASRHPKRAPRLRRIGMLMASVALLAALAACGGSGGEDPPPPGGGTPPPPPPPPPPPLPPPPPAGSSTISGTLRGPVGTQVVLQNNGSDDVTVTIGATPGPDLYGAQTFTFATPLADGAAYALSVKTTPNGQTCRVYAGASGTMPVNADFVQVGCEWNADHASRNQDNTTLGTYFDTFEVAIGGRGTLAEGRYIAFLSSASGIAGSSGNVRNVFWRDRLTGDTLLVSASAQGAEANANSESVGISADGQTVVFASAASDLVDGDTNGRRDVFVWSTTSGTGPVRVSLGAGGVQGNGDSYEAAISGNGRVVAFVSDADNLGGNTSGYLLRHDLDTGATTLVSRDVDTGGGVDGRRPSLSNDGTRIAFYSLSSKIARGDANGQWDIFVHDVTTDQFQRVSLTSTGGERDDDTNGLVAPAISGNGRYVAYTSLSTNVVTGDANGLQDVFVVDTQTGSVARASATATGGDGDSPKGAGERIAISHDGQWVAFTTMARNLGVGSTSYATGNVLMRNWATGQSVPLTDSVFSAGGPAAMSPDGAYVAFGAADKMDPRFDATGYFARYTGIGNAWWWLMP